MTGAAAQPAMVEKAQQLSTDKTIAATAAHMHPDQEDLAARLEAAQCTYGALGNGQADASKKEDTSEASYSSNRDSSSSSESDSDVSSGKERIPRFEKQAQSLEAQKAERKAHKAAVKESNRGRRKQKMKKHVKKRAINKHKHR
jgi:RIO kinase 1